MDMPWGSEPSSKFITNVGLITSDGPHGPNVMAAEWTHHVSYEPGMIAISIHKIDSTYENIAKTKEFGVNLCAIDQNVVASIAGGSHGKDVDKIAVLKELGVRFYKAKEIKAPMIEGAALNVECKVVQEHVVGDHVLLIGEAVDVRMGDKESISYHGGKYYKLGEQVKKPPQDVLDKIRASVEKHRK